MTSMAKVNNFYYVGANPTVDMVCINHEEEILLIKRSMNTPACPGMWALPGGFVDSTIKRGGVFSFDIELPEHAAVRETLEETNILVNKKSLSFIGIFEGDNRDPRDNEVSWSQSYAFKVTLSEEQSKEAKLSMLTQDKEGEIDNVQWVLLTDLHKYQLAFDHEKIINKALRNKL